MASAYAHGLRPSPMHVVSDGAYASVDHDRRRSAATDFSSSSSSELPRKMGIYGLARGDDGSEVLMLQSPSPSAIVEEPRRSWYGHLPGAEMTREASTLSSSSSMLSSLSSTGGAAAQRGPGRATVIVEDEEAVEDDDAEVEGVLMQDEHDLAGDDEDEEGCEGDEHSFFEEYDGAPGLYGRATAAPPPAPKRRQTTFLERHADEVHDMQSPLGSYPTHQPHLVAQPQAAPRAASFSLTGASGRRAWSPSVAASLYRPHDYDQVEYEQELADEDEYDWAHNARVDSAVELHPDAALLDAEIYAKAAALQGTVAAARESCYSVYDAGGQPQQVRNSATAAYAGRHADDIVVSRFFPHPQQHQQHQQQQHEVAESSPVHPYPTTQQLHDDVYYADPYVSTAAIDPYQPAAPMSRMASQDDPQAAPASLPPSPPSESGVHLSAWLAECVWSLLIHPYRPEKFGEADLRLEEQLREQQARQAAAAAYGGYAANECVKRHWLATKANGLPSSWYEESQYSSHGYDSMRSSFQSSSSSSSPVTPSPCNLYYNPYGLRSKPSQAFVDFVHRTLSQTLLSSTAVVLSLWYIRRFAVHAEGGADGRRLRQSLFDAAADPQGRGSEEVARRVLVLGLACSNKWLDDNTFTNKSWSDVTHLPLMQINRLEMLALGPISFDLSVDTPLWTKWLCEIHSHVSPFVTDSRLVQESIRQMFLALDDFEHRYDAEVVGPRERSRWAEAETDRRMAPLLHQLAFAHSPMFMPQQPPTTPSHLALDGFAGVHQAHNQFVTNDPFLSDAAAPVRRTSQSEWYASQARDPYSQWASPTSHPYMLSQQKERQHSAYGQALSKFWQSYMGGGADEQQPHGAYALPPLRNLAVMA